MEDQSIIILIMVGLAALMGVASFIHIVERNRQERARRESALRKKLSDLNYFLSGFPDGFLSADLEALIFKGCLNIHNQLLNNDPRNPKHRMNIDEIHAKLADYQQQDRSATFQPLENQQQVVDVRKLLNALMAYINRLQIANTITKQHVQVYTKQLQTLLTQTQVDTFIITATEAEANGNDQIARHNYTSALDKIKSTGLSKQYANTVDVVTMKLEHMKEANPEKEGDSQTADKESNSEWDNFLNEDDTWQKKSHYD